MFFSVLHVKGKGVKKGLESSLGPVSYSLLSGRDLIGVPLICLTKRALTFGYQF